MGNWLGIRPARESRTETIGAAPCAQPVRSALPRGRRPASGQHTPGSVCSPSPPNSGLRGPRPAPAVSGPPWPGLHVTPALARDAPAARPAIPEPAPCPPPQPARQRRAAPAASAPRRLPRNPPREPGTARRRRGRRRLEGREGGQRVRPRRGATRRSAARPRSPRPAPRGAGTSPRPRAPGARGGLTSNMSPSRKTIATQETMSA